MTPRSNNVMGLSFLQDGPTLNVSRWFPRLYFCDRANCLTLDRIRDSPAQRTLTSSAYSDPEGMTVEACVNFCNNHHLVVAGLENGQDCCECTPRSCLQGSLQFRDFVVLITRFRCQIVEIPRPAIQRKLWNRIAIPNALEIPIRSVAAVIVLAFTLRVVHSNLFLILFQKWKGGFYWDATGEHIPFTFFVLKWPLTDVSAS